MSLFLMYDDALGGVSCNKPRPQFFGTAGHQSDPNPGTIHKVERSWLETEERAKMKTKLKRARKRKRN